MKMLAVKNFFMPEKRVDSPRFSRMPEALMRSIRRRSLRVKRTKSLVLVSEKRKSDSFVNSQEWTAARGVTELRVGVLGSPDSGKSALVHRYLTGAYMQEESPEGGRFKKEVIIDGHSYLLLIRDEGGSPEMQFTAWVDAVIFVFSLDNEVSYNTVSNYFNKMSHYRNSAEMPIILVGTQDAISESSPRVVDDNRARKLSNELRRCSYYETCATYGLNVERVFQDACQKIVGSRLSASQQCLTGSRPVTPQPLANSPSHNHSTFLYKVETQKSSRSGFREGKGKTLDMGMDFLAPHGLSPGQSLVEPKKKSKSGFKEVMGKTLDMVLSPGHTPQMGRKKISKSGSTEGMRKTLDMGLSPRHAPLVETKNISKSGFREGMGKTLDLGLGLMIPHGLSPRPSPQMVKKKISKSGSTEVMRKTIDMGLTPSYTLTVDTKISESGFGDSMGQTLDKGNGLMFPHGLSPGPSPQIARKKISKSCSAEGVRKTLDMGMDPSSTSEVEKKKVYRSDFREGMGKTMDLGPSPGHAPEVESKKKSKSGFREGMGKTLDLGLGLMIPHGLIPCPSPQMERKKMSKSRSKEGKGKTIDMGLSTEQEETKKMSKSYSKTFDLGLGLTPPHGFSPDPTPEMGRKNSSRRGSNEGTGKTQDMGMSPSYTTPVGTKKMSKSGFKEGMGKTLDMGMEFLTPSYRPQGGRKKLSKSRFREAMGKTLDLGLSLGSIPLVETKKSSGSESREGIGNTLDIGLDQTQDSLPRGHNTLSASSHHLHRGASSFDASSNSSGISSTHVVEIHSTNGSDTSSRWGNSLGSHGSSSGLVSIATENNNVKFTAPHCLDNLQVKDKDLPTPSSTPTTSRKSRRRSNLFTPSKKGDDRLKNGELGSGRAIPLKQGYLYKKSSKALNKEWKKKYVTLCDDGRLTYHPSLHDYMEDVNGKEISLQYVTVKVPGQKPRGSKSIITTVPGYNGYSSLDLHDSIGGLSLGYKDKPVRVTDKALMSAFDTLAEPASSRQSLAEPEPAANGDKDTPHVKKRHRRMKSSGVKKDGEDDGEAAVCEFTIVSLDGKRWRWEVGGASGCAAAAERDAWVCAVEAQILASLQGRTSRQPAPTGANSTGDVRATYYIRRVNGNDKCCDCGANDPDWASLNLGVLICIECSGIHRNLGSHISRVRSLDLDEWPLGHVSVMVSMGNGLANSIWEADLRGHIKPIASSSREEKERWIRLKYSGRAFLSATAVGTGVESLLTASSRGAICTLARMLAVPAPRAPTPAERALALRAAAAAGQLVAAQLLIWHNGNPNYPDADGHTCVFYARAAANHLSGVPTQYPKNLQLLCPLHPNPPADSSNNSTSSNSSNKSNIKNPDPECNCIIFELLNAQSAANALVELLIGLQNNQYMNGYDGLNGSSFTHGTLGRGSSLGGLGGNLSLSNGKCAGSIV